MHLVPSSLSFLFAQDTSTKPRNPSSSPRHLPTGPPTDGPQTASRTVASEMAKAVEAAAAWIADELVGGITKVLVRKKETRSPDSEHLANRWVPLCDLAIPCVGVLPTLETWVIRPKQTSLENQVTVALCVGSHRKNVTHECTSMDSGCLRLMDVPRAQGHHVGIWGLGNRLKFWQDNRHQVIRIQECASRVRMSG